MTGRERLRQWLERSKLSQNQAAQLIGVHPAHLSHFVVGTRRPGLDAAAKIQQATGIPMTVWANQDSPEETCDAK